MHPHHSFLRKPIVQELETAQLLLSHRLGIKRSQSDAVIVRAELDFAWKARVSTAELIKL